LKQKSILITAGFLLAAGISYFTLNLHSFPSETEGSGERIRAVPVDRYEPEVKGELEVGSINRTERHHIIPEGLEVTMTKKIPDSKLFSEDFIRITPSADFEIQRINENSFRILFENLRQRTKYSIFIHDTSYNLTTPVFRVLSLSQTETDNPLLTLEFSSKVCPDSLLENIQVKYEGEYFPRFEVRNTEPSRTLDVLLRGAEHGSTANIELTTSLRDKAGNSLRREFSEFITINLEQLRLFCIDRRRKSTESGFEFHIEMREEDEENIGEYKTDRRHTRWRRSYSLPDIDLNVFREFVEVSPAVNFHVRRGENAFILRGDFKPQTEYEFTVRRGLYSNDGKILDEEYNFSYGTRDLKPSLSIMSKGHVMPSAYDNKIAVKHTNVSEVELSVRHIYPQNITYWLTGRRDSPTRRKSDRIERQKIQLHSQKNRETISYVDLSSALPEENRGVFHLEISHNNNRMDKMQLIISDIGLSVKEHEQGGARVWLRSLEDLEPIRNAKVQAVSYSNKVLEEVKTDREGSASFDKKPYVIIAKKGNDFNYIPLDEPKLRLFEDFTSGADYKMDYNYRAFIYSDRGVYRPNDKANIGIILRDKEKNSPEHQFPLRITITNPEGITITERTVKPNRGGMAELTQEFGNHPTTGKYAVRAFIGNDRVGSGSFKVEEFVPERLKVELTPVSEIYLKNETVEMNLKADYLFGAPAADSDYEAEITYIPHRFTSKKFPGYYSERHYYEDPQRNFIKSKEGNLDEEGKSSLKVDFASRNIDFDAPVKVNALASVFEAGSGRSTRKSASAVVLPGEKMPALRPESDTAQYREETSIDGVLLDRNGEMVESDDELTVVVSRVQYEWYYHYNEYDRRYRWEWVPYDYRISEERIEAEDGKFSVGFVPESSWGGYKVSVYHEDAVSEVFLPARWEWRYMAVRGAVGVSQLRKFKDPQYIELNTDKEEYKTGDTASVSFNAEFSGKALFSVESDRVHHSKWIDVEEGTNRIDYKIDEYLPNLYFSVNLLKGIPRDLSGGFEPVHAMGVKNVDMVPYRHKLPISLDVPELIEPNTEVEIGLSLGEEVEDAYAQIALVDEGILQLTNFQTPSPVDFFFEKCALQVKSYGNYGWLMGRIGAGEITGGGIEDLRDRAMLEAEADTLTGAERIAPIRIVSFWSGTLEVEDGSASVKFDVPYYNGKLRAMAVASSKNRMGSAEADVTVRDPLLLMPSVPRFLTIGDSVEIPLTVTNFTGSRGTVSVEASAGRGIELRNNRSEFTLEEGEEKTHYINLKVRKFAGDVKLSFKATGNGEKSRDSFNIPVIPPMFEQSVVHRVSLDEGTNRIEDFFEGWMSEYEKNTIIVNGMPYMNALMGIKRLIRYPFGCMEQIASATFPLLYIEDIMELVDPDFIEERDIHSMVMKGISEVISMQQLSGGFSAWPGSREARDWISVYAAHLLLEASRAGYPVPERSLGNARSYLRNIVTYRNYNYNKAYAYFVLARAGENHVSKIRQDIERLEKKSSRDYYRKNEELFLMAAALFLSGRRSEGLEIMHRYIDDIPEYKRYNDGPFYSSLRYLALKLYILETIEPAGEKGEKHARAIASQLSQHKFSSFYTTQELAWSTMALGKRVKNLELQKVEKATLTADGQRVKFRETTNGHILNAEGLSAFNKLELDVDNDSFAAITISGYPVDFTREESFSGVRVDLSSKDIEGNPKSLSNGYSLGDLGIIEVQLSNLTRRRQDNTAVVVRIPSGFDIENPRLKGDHKPDWIIQDQWDYDHMDIRDDRVEVFGSIGEGETVSFLFAVRATFRGNFQMPGSSAEMMYLPDNYYYGEIKNVQIK